MTDNLVIEAKLNRLVSKLYKEKCRKFYDEAVAILMGKNLPLLNCLINQIIQESWLDFTRSN